MRAVTDTSVAGENRRELWAKVLVRSAIAVAIGLVEVVIFRPARGWLVVLGGITTVAAVARLCDRTRGDRL